MSLTHFRRLRTRRSRRSSGQGNETRSTKNISYSIYFIYFYIYIYFNIFLYISELWTTSATQLGSNEGSIRNEDQNPMVFPKEKPNSDHLLAMKLLELLLPGGTEQFFSDPRGLWFCIENDWNQDKSGDFTGAKFIFGLVLMRVEIPCRPTRSSPRRIMDSLKTWFVWSPNMCYLLLFVLWVQYHLFSQYVSMLIQPYIYITNKKYVNIWCI